MNNLELAHRIISATLADLERIFTPEMRLTFVARDPKDPEKTVFISHDTIEELAAHLADHKTWGAYRG